MGMSEFASQAWLREALWPSFREKNSLLCAEWLDLNTRPFPATYKFTRATNPLPFIGRVTETRAFEDCSGRETDGKRVPGQVGTCGCVKENRLAEKELLNSTWRGRGLSEEPEIRTGRLKEH